MNAPVPRELRWQVNGLHLAGLAWGDPAARPLLALHGWLDNAASFSMLAPLLVQHQVVALDLTGHGRSDPRSTDAGYQIWEDLPELLGVLDALGWQHFDLLGHSRGAAIASIMAAAFPERIRSLVLLDGLAPEPVAEALFPGQLRKYVDDKRRWLACHNRVYASVDDAIASRAGDKLPPAAARLLVERNLRPCDGGYTWSTDLRLRGASAVKLTGGQIAAVLQGLSMPTLLLVAEQGLGGRPEMAALARRCIGGLQLESVAGGHHCHMESSVEDVAARINRFLLSTNRGGTR